MPPFHLLRAFARLRSVALCGLAACATLRAADTTRPAAAAGGSPGWDLAEFIDSLPGLLSERLPSSDRTSALRLYVRPHFGDFLHRDFVRVPFGARVKVTENLETTAELQSYFTHGLSKAAGYGLSGLRLGAKCEHVLPSINNGDFSVGFNYQTPFSRPPQELTDGHRHFQPYVAATNRLMPAWKLLGYASIGADLLDRTPIPAHFGRNQLHSNSLIFTAGAAREWKRFSGSLTATVNTSSLISDENKNVYSLEPEIVFPWRVKIASRSQILFTFSGRSVWGPDGHELGVSTSVRIEFILRRNPGGK